MADGTLPQLPDDVLQVIYGEVPLRRLLAHRAVCSHFDRVLPTVPLRIEYDMRAVNGLGPTRAQMLAGLLVQPWAAKLQHVNLHKGRISNKGMASLSAALPGCTALQTLNLAGNDI